MALVEAADTGPMDLVKLLVDRGANVNEPSRGISGPAHICEIARVMALGADCPASLPRGLSYNTELQVKVFCNALREAEYSSHVAAYAVSLRGEKKRGERPSIRRDTVPLESARSQTLCEARSDGLRNGELQKLQACYRRLKGREERRSDGASLKPADLTRFLSCLGSALCSPPPQWADIKVCSATFGSNVISWCTLYCMATVLSSELNIT